MGCEMLAASLEVFDPAGQLPFVRKLMPIIYLSRDYLDTFGKTLATIWVIFLLVGPDHDTVANFCSKVIAICTDMGTERLIARHSDFLPDFYALILNVRLPPTVTLRSSLFPLAMQSPGWNHGWDIVLKRGLGSLSWRPTFLDSLRSIIKFSALAFLWKRLGKVGRIPSYSPADYVGAYCEHSSMAMGHIACSHL